MKRVLRALIPLLLLLIGIGMVGYGVWGHTIAVVLKPETVETADASKSKNPPEETTADEDDESEEESTDESEEDEEEEYEEDEETSDENIEEEEEQPPPGGELPPWVKPAANPWTQAPAGDPWMSPPPDDPADESAEASHDANQSKESVQSEEKIVQDPEPVIIRDVTVGGVTMSPTGQLVRTYTVGKPPALCPT